VNAPELLVAWEVSLDDHVIDMSYSPDGQRLAAAALGGGISILRAASGDLESFLPGHKGGTFSLSWRADSRCLASGGQDRMLRIWDVAEAIQMAQGDAGADWVEHVAYSHSGDLVASAAGRNLRLWNSGAELLQRYPDHPSTISDLQWQPGTEFLTSVCYGQVATFRTDSPAPMKSFEWKGSILRLSWSPDANYIATGNQDASVHFWFRKTGKDLEMSGYSVKVRDLAWDHSSRYLATGGSATVIIWDCSGKGPAGTRPMQLEGHDLPITALSYQPAGPFLASGCSEGRVCVWNPGKSTRLIRQSHLASEVTRLQWAPDGRNLAASSAKGIIRVFRPSAD
jgi:WD40 repeat protein